MKCVVLIIAALLASIGVQAKDTGTIALENPGLKFGDVAVFSVDTDLPASVHVTCEVITSHPLVPKSVDLGMVIVVGDSVSVALLNTDSNQLYHPAVCQATLFAGGNGHRPVDVEAFDLAPIPYTDPVW
jgi:hypothetical protein